MLPIKISDHAQHTDANGEGLLHSRVTSFINVRDTVLHWSGTCIINYQHAGSKVVQHEMIPSEERIEEGR